MGVLLDAMIAARAHVESMWIDTCTIRTFAQVKDATTHITRQQEVIIAENVPCKLSHSSFSAADGGVAASRVLNVRLFLSPSLSIPAGSVIEVTTHAGAIEIFESSGVPAKYTNHQEINLIARDDKA